MDTLSLIGKNVRIMTYSMGDQWHEGSIVKAFTLKECENIVYEFVYKEGDSILIYSDQIAAVEILGPTKKSNNLKILNTIN